MIKDCNQWLIHIFHKREFELGKFIMKTTLLKFRFCIFCPISDQYLIQIISSLRVDQMIVCEF